MSAPREVEDRAKARKGATAHESYEADMRWFVRRKWCKEAER